MFIKYIIIDKTGTIQEVFMKKFIEEDILKKWPDAQFVKQKSKCRYFCFRGSKKAQNQHYKAIENLVKAYPKRNQ